MTVVAVKVNKKTIDIACDSQVTWGGHKMPINDKSDKQLSSSGKIVSVNDMVIGFSGDLSHASLLQIYCKTHKPKDATNDDVLNWFIEFKEWANKKAQIGFNDISLYIILIYQKKAFAVFDFLEVYEIKKFDAIGSGMFIAIGAMECDADVEKAVQVAIKYQLGCGGEIIKKSVSI